MPNRDPCRRRSSSEKYDNKYFLAGTASADVTLNVPKSRSEREFVTVKWNVAKGTPVTVIITARVQ